ncbi:hypothetical protein Mp_2g05900 [Marchantia polymorpha subsp. ruderalis]|nr:hypothetical protein MARPO_0021s0046 [Marchantia polymorpha]BBN01247.1 hypothetical protein Mp_2g05900 [Marchantia polymorpha subsp. ruderalis]|eukprot:PTQ44173.1 hypothetical protein MARPO_0021s0046 [Marchantia polymorpha]
MITPSNSRRSAEDLDASSSSASVSGHGEGSRPAAAEAEAAEEDPGPIMDAEVWGGRHIPEEVVHTILAWLPPRSYCRLRAVCRSWNESAQSAGFGTICRRIPAPAPFWVVFACGGPLVYDTTHGAWHVAASFLSYDCFAGEAEAILEAAGSLLFYRNFDPQDRLMVVFNPMSKRRTRLPALPPGTDVCPAMGIVLDRAAASYTIYAVAPRFRSRELLTLQLFDSTRGRWEPSGSLLRDPEDPRDERHEVLSSACCHGGLYFLTERLPDEFEPDEPPRRPFQVFRAGPATWDEVPALLPAGLSFPKLFENRGRLLLGAGTAGRRPSGLLSVRVWQLLDRALEWVEILRMPDELVPRVAAGFPVFALVANGDFIGVGSGQQRKIVRYMCDLTKGSWWALPSEYQHVALHHLEGLTSSGTLLFEPRLDTAF